jgi:hypothetical protein
MLQDEVVAALLANSRAGLIIDRRERHLEAASLAAGLVLSRVWRTQSDFAGGPIYLGLLTSPDPARCLPRTIALGDVSYTRRVDRFYFPAARDAMLTATLFNFISSIYDDMISRDVNLSVAEDLLRLVAGGEGTGSREILDYGCGTGLALEACRRLCIGGTVSLTAGDQIGMAGRCLSSGYGHILERLLWSFSGSRAGCSTQGDRF